MPKNSEFAPTRKETWKPTRMDGGSAKGRDLSKDIDRASKNNGRSTSFKGGKNKC